MWKDLIGKWYESLAAGNLPNILKGIYYFFRGKEQKLHDQRIAYCKKCSELAQHPILGNYCDACGCLLRYKLRVENEECPKNKW